MLQDTETVGEGKGHGIVDFLLETFPGHRDVDFPKFDNAQGSEDATFSVAVRILDILGE